MKTTLILFILFTGFKVFSQDIEKIKKADTIYIYFKADKEQHQIHHKEKTLNNELNYDNYFFSFPNGQLSMEFSHHYKFSPDVRKEKKSFLKKNKALILDYDFINRIGNLKATELIGYRKKVVYLIDYEDTTCFKIILKQVDVMGPRMQSIE